MNRPPVSATSRAPRQRTARPSPVAYKTGVFRGLGTATTIPAPAPVEEQLALAPARATAVSGSDSSERRPTA